MRTLCQCRSRMHLSPHTHKPGNVRFDLLLFICRTFASLTHRVSDISILSRLADAEARLQALENQASRDDGSPPLAQPRRAAGESESVRYEPAIALAPTFHTASGHQMIYSWPRLRLCLSSYGNSLAFLADADEQGPFLADHSTGHRFNPRESSFSSESSLLRVWQVTAILESFNNRRDKPLLILTALLDAYVGFKQGDFMEYLHARNESLIVCPDDLSLPYATLLCLALASDVVPFLSDQLATSSLYLNSILQRQWTLWNKIHERIAVSLALAYCLLYTWARPFHALGVLQSVKPAIKRMAVRVKSDPYAVSETPYRLNCLPDHTPKPLLAP